jgi:hypothetical protein
VASADDQAKAVQCTCKSQICGSGSNSVTIQWNVTTSLIFKCEPRRALDFQLQPVTWLLEGLPRKVSDCPSSPGPAVFCTIKGHYGETLVLRNIFATTTISCHINGSDSLPFTIKVTKSLPTLPSDSLTTVGHTPFSVLSTSQPRGTLPNLTPSPGRVNRTPSKFCSMLP